MQKVIKKTVEVSDKVAAKASYEVAKFVAASAIVGYCGMGMYRVFTHTVQAVDHARYVLAGYTKGSNEQMIIPDGITLDLDSGENLDGPFDERKLDKLIADSAHVYHIDPRILRGMVQTESSGNPSARNEKSNALGLGQLLPSTRRKLHLSDAEAKDPRSAVDAAAYWFKLKVDEEGGDDAKAVQSYYCGPGRDCIGTTRGMEYLRKVAQAPSAPKMLGAKRGKVG